MNAPPPAFRRDAPRPVLAPSERSEAIACCAKLGFRLGRVKVFGLEGAAVDSVLDFALQKHMINNVFGMSILAGRLSLPDKTRRAVSEVVSQVEAFYAMAAEARRKEDPRYLDLANKLYDDLKVDLDLVYDSECKNAFVVAYDLLQTELFFRMELNPTSTLQEVLYSDDSP